MVLVFIARWLDRLALAALPACHAALAFAAFFAFPRDNALGLLGEAVVFSQFGIASWLASLMQGHRAFRVAFCGVAMGSIGAWGASHLFDFDLNRLVLALFLSLMFAYAVGVGIGGLAMRLVGWRIVEMDGSRPDDAPLRWSLRGLIVVTAIAATTIGAARLVRELFVFPETTPLSIVTAFVSLSLAATSGVAVWAMLRPGHRLLRTTVFAASAVGLGVLPLYACSSFADEVVTIGAWLAIHAALVAWTMAVLSWRGFRLIRTDAGRAERISLTVANAWREIASESIAIRPDSAPSDETVAASEKRVEFSESR